VSPVLTSAKKSTLALLVLVLVSGFATGQSIDDELVQIGNSLRQEINKQMPGWTCKSIQPIQGSSGVIVEHCRSGDILVSIAVSERDSQENAQAAFNESKAHLRLEEQVAANHQKQLVLIKEELTNLGDEGFVWNIRGSEAVVFRKGKFIVNTSVPTPANNKDAFFSRKFAEYVAKVLENH